MFNHATLRLRFGPRAGAVRNRYSTSAQVAVEALEGRALLSHMSLAHALPAHHPVASVADVSLAIPTPPHIHRGPILAQHGVGFVAKVPRFYPYYEGVKRGEINAAGAKAFTDRQGVNVTFVGIVAGTINAQPKTADKAEYYLFVVDRGLTPGPGPFPGRPNIKFDSIVYVAITPAGTTGLVQDLSTGVQTTLTTNQITVSTDNIHVTVPTTLFIPAGRSPTVTPTVNFIPLDAPLPGNFINVTSFASEFRNFPVSFGPIAHRGHEV